MLVLAVAAACGACGDGGAPAAGRPASSPAPTTTSAAPPPTGTGAPPSAPDAGPAAGSCLAAVEVAGRTYVWWEPPSGVAPPPPTGPELAAVVPPCGDADLYEGVPTTPSSVRVRALEGVPVEEAVTLDGRVHLVDPSAPPAGLTGP
ncbi:hypothetical protein WDZ16_02845 [Pseudokineococcus marinus]|uniref:Uncharacterized protein n=1 Tax=Pseudokineococcus marinus TaxID=351215 RepID=A0A849BP67_9ACTN|nr:hypothetical protein [Pseudokineococcus marinus]NNH22622.1 hypothetical protein [Pseudokineococcus marinus]